MLPPQLQEPEEGEGEPQIDPRMRAMMAQVEQAAQEIAQRGQVLQQAQAEIEKQAMEVGADKTELDAAKVKLESERKVFMAEAATKMLQIENASLKLMQEGSETEESINNASGVAQALSVLAETVNQLLASTAQNAEIMAAAVNAMAGVTDAVSRPKKTVLVFDDSGNPVGTETVPSETMQ